MDRQEVAGLAREARRRTRRRLALRMAGYVFIGFLSASAAVSVNGIDHSAQAVECSGP
jgi:hypothetical protein